MKVLHCITLSELGGSQVDILEVIRRRVAGIEWSLCVGQKGWLVDEALRLGIPCYELPELVRPIRPWCDVIAIWKLYRLLKSIRPDLVHLHTAKAGVVGRLAARLAGVRSVYSPHGWSFSGRSGLFLRTVSLFVERLLGSCGDATVCVSLDEFALAKRFKVATEEQIRMIYNGVSDVDFRASPGEAAEPTLAMVARFAPPKEQAFVLRALAAITTPYKMLFIGDGPDRDSAQAMARQLGIQDRIVFAGARTDVAELLSGCHVLVHAARYEALGLCLLEGMRAGLPVVAIATGGVPEVVEDGTTGILVEHGDLAGFRNALSKLINDPALRARMGQEGRRRFLTRFSVNRTLEALYRVYNEVTGPVRGAMPDTFHAAPDLKA